jgi:G3E family GTPase
MARDSRLSVAILTGFLGSGKTTLLSQLLVHPGMGETAVIVNELGEVAIDHHLLRRVDERTVLLGNGCVCCALRGDLADELRDLLARRERGEIPAFRRVVLETTGVADPGPIVATLLSEPLVKHRFRLQAVVTTVDAVNGSRALRRGDASVKQAAAADRLVITKTDLADEGATAALRLQLARLNPVASVLESSFGDVDPRDLFAEGRGRDGVLTASSGAHAHDDEVTACCFTFDRPLDWAAFGIWLTMLLQARGDDIFRVKGLIDTGGPGPVLLNGVQHAVHPPVHLDRWPDADTRSRVVFIGRRLDAAALRASLWAFAAAGSH